MILQHKQSDQPIFIIGCGDIGKRVGQRLLQQDAAVHAIVRRSDAAKTLSDKGFVSYTLDFDEEVKPGDVNTTAVQLFYFMPPSPSGEQDKRMSRVLTLLERTGLPARILYISTTGVYGNTHGDWVTEESPTTPDTGRAQRRLDAEQQLQQWCEQHDVEYVILRVPGIYGDGRWPLERLRQQKPVLLENESVYVNRIHAEDLTDICIKAMQQAPSQRIYNVSDGQPCSMTSYFNQLADAFDLPRPPQIARADAESKISPAMLSYMDESRRVSNELLVKELQINLRYPSLADALRDVSANEK